MSSLGKEDSASQALLSRVDREQSVEALVKEAVALKQFVGQSDALLDVVKKIPAIARWDASVLVTGETGTGKEVCARAIHYLSPRAGKPFVPINCGAIPVELLENELFGHGAGAFTSANASQAGVIQEADGGTLFLDEVDSLPLAAQVKLLRFLQDKEYRPLGARHVAKANVRIAAASNANLEELLQAGKFRRDLFYRLNVLRVHLPPLRDRKEDLPLLARHFLAKVAAQHPGAAREIAPGALRKLGLYDWPGNVRELENVIERAALLCATEVIQSEEIELPAVADAAPEPESFRALKARVVADFERNHLRNLLAEHRGNIARAARASRKNRRVFFQLMRKHHIRVERATDAQGEPLVKIVIADGPKAPRSLRL